MPESCEMCGEDAEFMCNECGNYFCENCAMNCNSRFFCPNCSPRLVRSK